MSMAPSLESSGLSAFWVVDLDSNGERELIAGYQLQDNKYDDSYFSTFVLRWMGSVYQVSWAGWFLEGTLHAIREFGPAGSERKLVYRFLSCTECEPWVWLTILDFSKNPDGSAFEFTYNNRAFGPEVEYELPGMGHSIDATVETRVPASLSARGPHLIQHYVLEEGGEEWWVFHCGNDHRCRSEAYKKKPLPVRYRAIWKSAETL